MDEARVALRRAEDLKLADEIADRRRQIAGLEERFATLQAEAKKVYEKEKIDISTQAARVRHVVQSCFAGRRIVVFSGGAAKGEDAVFDDARAILAGGGNGSIIGRNSFQRPREDALAMLDSRQAAALARRIQRGRGQRALAAFSPAPLHALLRERRARLDGVARQLEALSYNAILARGFALVRDAEGGPLTRAADVAPGTRLSISFADGQVAATADDGGAKKRGKPAARTQGSLL
jgi:exonuclease VII large subunit